MEQPKVIFFDAVGTLFGVRGSVGEIYSAIALAEAGIELTADSVDRAFIQSFKASKPPVFPGVEAAKIPQMEFEWWEEIARDTFAKVGVFSHFSDFRAFFGKLYDYFATDRPWYIYSDVIPALQVWQDKGVELAIISNFDTRLDRVLELLELKQFFCSVTISSITGSAKPDSQIFLTALAKHNCQSKEVWHIGDSLNEDYLGAQAVGIKPFLLDRSNCLPIGAENRLHNLIELR
jgi:putative hydrolase of the HAD superfamily